MGNEGVHPSAIEHDIAGNLNNSMKIFNNTFFLVQIVIAMLLLAGILSIFSFCVIGFWGYNKITYIKKSADKNLELSAKILKETETKIYIANKTLKQVKEHTDVISKVAVFIEKTQNNVNSERANINQSANLFLRTKEITEETALKLDDFISKTVILENFGITPSTEDYKIRSAYFLYKHKFEEAIESINKAISSNVGISDLTIYKGIILATKEKYSQQSKIPPDSENNQKNGKTLIAPEKIVNKIGGNQNKTQVLEKKAKTEQDYLKEANKFAMKNQFDPALKAYDKAIELNPNLAEAWYNKASILIGLNRYDDGITAYDKATAITPDNEELWLKKAKALSSVNRYEEAIYAYDKVISLNHKNITAWLKKGNLLMDLNKYAEANDSYGKAIELNPKDADVWYNKGNALSELNRQKEAVAAYDKAIEINPDFNLAWYNKGIIFALTDKPAEAVTALDKAIGILPTDAQAWSKKGVALTRLNKYQDAILAHDKAVNINPNIAETWYNRGCAYSLYGNKTKAISDIEKAVKIDPSFKDIAKSDSDLKSLSDDPEFKKLIQ